MNSSDYFILSGIIISLISLGISIVTLNSSSRQFNFLNQGYLKAEPNISGLTRPDINILSGPVTVNDDISFQGLNFIIDITNIGNLPVEYKILTFDIFINKVLRKEITKTDNSMGILYPSQNFQFITQTIFFQQDKSLIFFKEIKELDIKCRMRIEYNDLGLTNTKIIDRDAFFLLYDNTIATRYTSFNDRI